MMQMIDDKEGTDNIRQHLLRKYRKVAHRDRLELLF